MERTIKPRKVAVMISTATDVSPILGTTWCGYLGTRSCGMLLPCGVKSNMPLISVSRELPPHPQPFSPTGESEHHSHSPAGEKGARVSAGRHTDGRSRDSFDASVASAEAS